MNLRARAIALTFAAAVLLAACSKVTPENFARVQDGMSEQEVSAILGSPAESSSTSVLGISGTTSKWAGGGAVITIRFVNGKVALKSFDKPAAK
jgi:hypothetical protein